MFAKAPELNLDPEEASEIAKSYALVARHYNWAPQGKALDWTNFMMALSLIYGSKFAAIKMRKAAEKAERAHPQNPAQEKIEPTPAPVIVPFEIPLG